MATWLNRVGLQDQWKVYLRSRKWRWPIRMPEGSRDRVLGLGRHLCGIRGRTQSGQYRDIEGRRHPDLFLETCPEAASRRVLIVQEIFKNHFRKSRSVELRHFRSRQWPGHPTLGFVGIPCPGGKHEVTSRRNES